MPPPSGGTVLSPRSTVLGWVRLVIVYAFVAALLLVSRPTWPLVAAGAVFVVAGEALRMWAAGHLVKSMRLITSGPYARTQNPLYLGRLLILTGVGIAARGPAHVNLIALALGYAVFFLYYMPRKLRVEGSRLARLHGVEFAAYHDAVPILLPSIRRYPAASRDRWSFRRMVRNQEPIVAAGLLIVLGVLVAKAV
jgi:protein-S-isoprenylcysteine O-methyltransferase Ste14